MPGNTQEQTADLLGISRVKVNRLLAGARESGIVKLSIEHRFVRMVEVEENSRRRYNLSFCGTTPPLMSYSPTRRKSLPSRAKLEAESPIARRAVGIVAAELLFERLQADESCVIGVGWGRTVAEVPNHLVGITKPGVKFVSGMGSLTRTLTANLFEVVYQFAERTGGEGNFFLCRLSQTPSLIARSSCLSAFSRRRLHSPNKPASTWQRLGPATSI